MKNLLFACALLLAFGCSAPEKATHVLNDRENPRYLFVLNANSGTFKGQTLTLEGIPSVIYFSDRPHRVAGHMSLQQFKKVLEKHKDEPSANLSILQLSPSEDVVFDVKSVEVRSGDISLKLEGVEGNIPDVFLQSALFIEMESLSGADHFAMEDFHPLDCSCGNIADGN